MSNQTHLRNKMEYCFRKLYRMLVILFVLGSLGLVVLLKGQQQEEIKVTLNTRTSMMTSKCPLVTVGKLHCKLASSRSNNVASNKAKKQKNTSVNKKKAMKKKAVKKNVVTGKKLSVSKKEYEILLRIVEAETTGGDVTSKLMVANVVLNRVKHPKFPNTIEKVVFQKNQFSPTIDGRYYSVSITKETKEGVKRVLDGEDQSQGALFFSARDKADPDCMKWFDQNLKRLFEYGGHEYFTFP